MHCWNRKQCFTTVKCATITVTYKRTYTNRKKICISCGWLTKKKKKTNKQANKEANNNNITRKIWNKRDKKEWNKQQQHRCTAERTKYLACRDTTNVKHYLLPTTTTTTTTTTMTIRATTKIKKFFLSFGELENINFCCTGHGWVRWTKYSNILQIFLLFHLFIEYLWREKIYVYGV